LIEHSPTWVVGPAPSRIAGPLPANTTREQLATFRHTAAKIICQ
jgi:hypothetical protein